jgi:hypothetical protein
MGMFEKAGGTSAIQGGTDRGMVLFSMGQNLVAFCGTFEIAGLAGRVAARPECKGKTEKYQKNLSILSIPISLVCSAFRGMNLGAMHRKKRSFSILAKCGGCKRWTVELRRAVEEMRVLV